MGSESMRWACTLALALVVGGAICAASMERDILESQVGRLMREERQLVREAQAQAAVVARLRRGLEPVVLLEEGAAPKKAGSAKAKAEPKQAKQAETQKPKAKEEKVNTEKAKAKEEKVNTEKPKAKDEKSAATPKPKKAAVTK